MGSGVAGALLACRLARAGVKVDLIESGPRVDRAQAVEGFARHHSIAETYPSGPDQPRWGEEQHYYEQRGSEPFGAVYERLVGGTTWHWLGTCLRFLESDFRLRSRYGVGLDWPLSLSELQPYYRQAEEELGVAGAFLPPLPPTYLDQQVARAAARSGYRVEVLPAARNSVEYQGRPACRGSATCLPICPIGAKYDASVHVEQAERAGARLWDETRVTRVVADAGRVQYLEARRQGQTCTLEADHYILAANAIESPRLLLFSGYPGTQLGHYLMGMAGQVSQALAPRPIWPFRSPQVVSGVTQCRDGPLRAQRAGWLLSIGNDGWPGGTPPEVMRRLVDQGVRGPELCRRVAEHISRQFLLISNCEELPRYENRVSLSHLLDSQGMPRPRIHFSLSEYTRAGIEEALRMHARIFECMEAFQIHHYEESSDPAHLAGTCRMGLDPALSVVDPDLRSHHWPNLSVVGSAVFPTVGCAPPTLTVAALALRLADFLTLQS